LNWLKQHYTLVCTILITVIYPCIYLVGYQINYFVMNDVFVLLFLQVLSSLLAIQFSSFLYVKTVLANE